jgi:TatD DNase family protein
MAAPPEAPRVAAQSAGARLIDTHTHLTDRRFAGDLAAVVQRARDAGLVGMVVVGYDLASSEAAVTLASQHPDVWATVGIHPHHATAVNAGTLKRLEQLAASPRVVGIGECGLDYYRNLSPAAKQREAFAVQLDLAAERSLPVVVHSRDAMPATLDILGRHRLPRGGVMHCFDGTAEDARASLAFGLYVSCAGPLTYRKDATLARAIAAVADDRIVVETDCPYLSPAGHRGERNEPALVRLVADAAARARGVGFEEMARQTTRNAVRLFDLPLALEQEERSGGRAQHAESAA